MSELDLEYNHYDARKLMPQILAALRNLARQFYKQPEKPEPDARGLEIILPDFPPECPGTPMLFCPSWQLAWGLETAQRTLNSAIRTGTGLCTREWWDIVRAKISDVERRIRQDLIAEMNSALMLVKPQELPDYYSYKMVLEEYRKREGVTRNRRAMELGYRSHARLNKAFSAIKKMTIPDFEHDLIRQFADEKVPGVMTRADCARLFNWDTQPQAVPPLASNADPSLSRAVRATGGLPASALRPLATDADPSLPREVCSTGGLPASALTSLGNDSASSNIGLKQTEQEIPSPKMLPELEVGIHIPRNTELEIKPNEELATLESEDAALIAADSVPKIEASVSKDVDADSDLLRAVCATGGLSPSAPTPLGNVTERERRKLKKLSRQEKFRERQKRLNALRKERAEEVYALAAAACPPVQPIRRAVS